MRLVVASSFMLLWVGVAQLGCGDDKQPAPPAAGGDSSHAGEAPQGGTAPSQGGADAASGGGTEAYSCLPVACANLSESACKNHAATAEADGCVARYGVMWPDDPEGDSRFAGCASQCCESNEECPVTIDAEVCAINELGECWLLWSPPVPEGWVLLGIDGCDAYPECDR